MYHRPSPTNCPATPQQNTGSFYYDYSEEFEDRNPPFSPLTHSTVPLCPIPQRAVSLSRPMVLRAEQDGDLDIHAAGVMPSGSVADTEPTEANVRPSNPYTHTSPSVDSPAARFPPQIPQDFCPSGDEKSSSSLLCYDTMGDDRAEFMINGLTKPFRGPELRNVEGHNDTLSMASDEHQRVKVRRSHTTNAIPSSPSCSVPSLRNSGLQKPERKLKRSRRSKTHSSDDITSPLQAESTSQMTAKKARYKSDLTASESAPLLGYKGHYSRFSQLHGLEWSREAEQQFPHVHDGDFAKGSQKEMQGSEFPSSMGPTDPHTRQNNFRKGHRRNLATARISTSNLVEVGISTNQVVETETPEACLSPHSHTVENATRASSIDSSLMKASSPVYTTELIKSRVNSRSPVGITCNVQRKNSQDLNDHSDSETQEDLPKFRVRLKHSATLDTSSESEPMSASDLEQVVSQEESANPLQRRLRIRIAKGPRAGRAHAGLDGTVLRSPALKQCNSLADLEHCVRMDMFTNRCQVGEVFSEKNMEESNVFSSNAKSTISTSRKLKSCEESSPNLDIQSSTLPTSEQIDPGSRGQKSSRPRILRHARSLGSDIGHSSSNRGIREKLSFLKLRMNGAHQGREFRDEHAVLPSRILEESKEDTVSSKEMTQSEQSDLCKKQSTPPQRSTKKLLRRWTRGARKAVRSCVKRTLDRSTDSKPRPPA